MEREVAKDCPACMVKPNYHIFTPQNTESIQLQWQSCFNSFQQYLAANPLQKAFMLRIFVSAGNADDFQQTAQMIKASFSGSQIPFSILAEAPEKPWQVIIEAGFADASQVEVAYGQAGTLNFCQLSVPGFSEYWLSGSEGGASHEGIRGSAAQAFARLKKATDLLQLKFDHLVRQWNYVEQIFGFQQLNSKNRQHYQLFNEVRSEYYSNHRSRCDFPAATGIGVDQNGVTIECMLMKGNSKLKVIPISNPKQLNSYKYGQTVLKGDPANQRKANQVPQFERAKLVTNGRSSRVFVSGTASIVGQETIGPGDVEKQTRTTIDNMELLTSKMNLKSHCPELTVYPEKYAYVRVYVKEEKDIPKVKSICREHFGHVPITFVKADICRADLLVEIEAEKIS
ncbi:hypothetical protein [Gaoshiqia sediminis]|uniref:Chorismatase FkbO/Hyg5-like N-terminal domain-containing protein n=1 Tax=Gaoshiqia sediminis TaxID=2986998 RepID=A0AA41Y7S3_9BACT|nr:hypothetical protein [Gaoshiqia sediminis]MCW0483071.1 hypothetical protein [Gaoshiqia sediminis]